MTTEMQQLTMLEGQLQNVVSQKQQYNRQVLEFDNAIAELSSVDDAYQIVGSVMIKKNSEEIKKDLEKKKEIAELRMKTLSKQEEELQVEVQQLQKKLMQDLDKQ